MSHQISRCLYRSFIALMACAMWAQVRAEVPEKVPEYHQNIQPILDQKCVTCHACYDAPCQLNLQSEHGLKRGASKVPVYDGTRLKDAHTTRIHVDGQSFLDWLDKGFFPVLPGYVREPKAGAVSLLQGMIELGRQHPVASNQALPSQFEVGIDRENECPAPDEFEDYAKKTPDFGMPYGMAPLTENEYQTLMQWLRVGAPVSSEKIEADPGVQMQVASWELFLNREGKREQLVARYLYEHLFLAHLYFESDAHSQVPSFFRLVRSRTPAGEPLDVIATRRINDDPGGEFYYRLVRIDDSIVHKTHITYALSEAKRAHLQRLFFKDDWDVDTLPGYDRDARANPFLTFAAIPAKARYQFMLDDAEYFTRNFIRGPVCHGPVATAVIRDHFWTFFEDPETEQYVNDATYRERVSPYLGLPGQKTDLLSLGSEWLKYSGDRNDYLSMREEQYRQTFPEGASLNQIWDGDGHNQDAYLTIFRHHDSASVERGLHGRIPRTAWLMDYPLLERGYYELVVGFDVFGSVSHQAQTRLYFDLIRNGSEQNILRFLPQAERKQVYKSWYQKSGVIKTYLSYHALDEASPTAVVYSTDTAYQELMERLPLRNPDIALHPDRINRCHDTACRKGLTDTDATLFSAFSSLTSGYARDIKGIQLLPNLSFVRVDMNDGNFRTFTLIRNRAHSNVAFILGEDLRYLPEEDTVTVLPFLLGSYPNFIFRMQESEVTRFTEALRVYNGDALPKAFIDRWGLRRTAPDFWQVYQDFVEHQRRYDPVEAGIYDLNRYQPW